MKNKKVIVTTEYRGVFAGKLVEQTEEYIILKHARMCVRWSSSMHGILGLGAKGPNDACRISPAVPRITLKKVTSVTEMTDVAWKAWEKEPWG